MEATLQSYVGKYVNGIESKLRSYEEALNIYDKFKDEQELEKELKSNVIEGMYLMYGEETFLLESSLKKMKKILDVL